jgi:nitrate reductase cytochrome c-type subunit
MFSCTKCNVTCKTNQGLSSHMKRHDRETGETKAVSITHRNSHQKQSKSHISSDSDTRNHIQDQLECEDLRKLSANNQIQCFYTAPVLHRDI